MNLFRKMGTSSGSVNIWLATDIAIREHPAPDMT
jgi:hypothetical protein